MLFRLQSAIARLRAVATTVLGLTLLARTGHAQDERCSAGHSACIQSNQHWLPLRPGSFATIDSARPRGKGSVAAALAVGYQHEPLVLRAWSPDPAGRWLPLVEHVVDAAMVMNFGLSERLDLGTAFVMVPYQKGLGIDAARSQQSSGLERTALRDPRLGIGYAAFEHSDGDSRYLLRVRTDLTLPLGDTRSFARDRSPVLAPGGSLVSRRGRFEAGLDASFRLKQSVTLGDVRHGSQLVTHLGVALDLWSDERLRASLETSWFWNVAPRTREAREAHLRHLPAEWLLGLVSRLNGRSSLGLYGGAGLPSSARRIDLGERQGPRESFVGLGAPDLRLLLVFVQTSARSEP